MKFSTLIASAAAAMTLTACLVPERFTAKMEVRPDASYTFTYNGTAVFAPAAMEIKQKGTLNAKDEAALKKEAEKMRKVPDVRQANYKGEGRFDLSIVSEKKPGQPLRMLDIFTVSTDKDGVMTIASTELDEKSKKDLSQLGIHIDGTLEVKLPKNAEILSQNATSTPSFFGMFGSYGWKIGGLDQRPVMKIRIKP